MKRKLEEDDSDDCELRFVRSNIERLFAKLKNKFSFYKERRFGCYKNVTRMFNVLNCSQMLFTHQVMDALYNVDLLAKLTPEECEYFSTVNLQLPLPAAQRVPFGWFSSFDCTPNCLPTAPIVETPER